MIKRKYIKRYTYYFFVHCRTGFGTEFDSS
jgi:hypothetical protein